MDFIQNTVLWFGRIFPEAFARQLADPSGLFAGPIGTLLDRTDLDMKAAAIELLDLYPSDHVLEIGVAGGGTLAALAKRVPQGVVAGMESSDTFARRARVRFRREIAAGRMDISSGNVTRIPVDDASFDRALSIHAIYFWDDPLDALEEIQRVLKPGGRFLLATGDQREMDELPWVQHGFRTFEEQELQHLLRSAGFNGLRHERGDGTLFHVSFLLATKPG